MNRVITNTFTLTAVKDNEAVRDNLIHCSLFQQDRLGWWSQPTASNAINYGVVSGQYGINGYNVYQLHAKPGSYIDLSQPIGLSDPDNTDKAGFALADNEWYTLSFTCRGVHRHVNEDGSSTDLSKPTLLYVYVYPSVIDTAEKIIVDGEQRSAPGDMCTAIPVTWDIEEHTITFKTKALSTQPKVLFRAFGEGTTAYDSVTFADGGCFARIAKVKVEQGKTATPYTPHYTESMPSVHAVAFKRTNTDISSTRPTGGTYYSPTPSGWDDGIPSGIMRLWETKAVFVPELPSATWGLPSPVGDTLDLNVEFSPYEGIPTTPTGNIGSNNGDYAAGGTTPNKQNLWFDPTRNSGVDFSSMVWRAERKILNGVKSSWVISKIKGEDGTSFTAKGSADKHYASLSAYNAATDRVVGKYYLVDSTSGAVMYKYNESAAIACDDGDAYTTSDLHLWVKNGPIWADLGKIQGPQGAQGPQGEGGMSCTLVPSVQSIPVDSNGRPTISKFTLTAKIYKGSTLMGENDKTYSIVSHVSYKGATTPVTSSTNASFNLDVNLDKTKVLNSVSCFIQRGQTVLYQFNLYPHADGQNTVRLDLDNEMDSVVCDNNGNLLAETTIQTTLRLYDGAELKASEQYGQLKETDFKLNEITPVKTVSSDRMTCTFSWTFNAGLKFSDARYIKDFSIQYNSTFYLATFTLNAMRNGENGDDAVRYNVSASESAISFKRKADNIISPSSVVLKCNVVKAVGETISLVSSDSNKVPGASLYLYYKRVGYDTYWQTLTISSGEVTVRSSDEISAIKFCLSTASSYNNVDSNIIDIETVPVIIDGLNGNNGIDGVNLDFLASANTIMMDDKGVEPSTITFTAMSAQGENAPGKITSSAYNIVVTEYYNGGNESTTKQCNEEPKGQLVYNIKYRTSVEKLVAELKYNTTTYRTLTIPVVKKGADGRSYNPVPRGVYAAGNTYVWDAKQRDYVDYEFGGVYYRFGVKTYDTSVTAAPTSDKGDDYWEVCNRVSCLITNCIFGTNAVIGGFMASSEKFMSTENAYALRYMRSYETTNKVNYRGAWTGSGTSYAKDEAVYYNGTYYYSKTSGNTATPSGSSNWASCSNLLIERIQEVGTGTVYLYEYDNATLKRPVVQFGGTYYTIKKMGAATTEPTSSDSNWRELTDIELSFLSVGNGSEATSVLSYVPKYTLNGKNGTVVMLQADDTCWTYDDTGKQVNGIPYGKRIEIVPASKSIDVYDDNGDLALQVNGDTYETIDKAYGSGKLNLSSTTPSGKLESLSTGITRTMQSLFVGEFEVSNYPLNLSLDCAFNITATEIRTTTTPNGNYGGVTSIPYNVGNEWVYRNDCQGTIIVQKQNSDKLTWSNYNQLVSLSTAGKSGTISRYSGVLSCVLQPGTYRLVFVFTASLFGTYNTGSSSKYSYCSFNITYVSASGDYAIETSRIFANGLAFGSATNDNFMVVREAGGIHVKASTKKSGHCFELSQDKGFEVKRNDLQGIVPVLLWYGFVTDSGSSLSVSKKYSCDGNNPTFTRSGNGLYKLTLHSNWQSSASFSGGNVIATITAYGTSNANTTGTSARIKEMGTNYILIETANDREVDNSSLIIKLEYIG